MAYLASSPTAPDKPVFRSSTETLRKRAAGPSFPLPSRTLKHPHATLLGVKAFYSFAIG